jgi:hypothetical protein
MDDILARLHVTHEHVRRRLIAESPNWIRRRNILSSAQLVYAAA